MVIEQGAKANLRNVESCKQVDMSNGCIAMKKKLPIRLHRLHAEAAVKQGATRDEVMETMGMAIYMGAGPSVMYAAQALEAFDQFSARTAEK